MRQGAKRTDDYVNGLKWQHQESTARFRCCKNWSSFHYFKGDPTRVKEPREGSPISFSLLHSVQTVIFAGFKIWNLILQDVCWFELKINCTSVWLLSSYQPKNVSKTLCSKNGFKSQFRGMSTVLHINFINGSWFYHTSDLE